MVVYGTRRAGVRALSGALLTRAARERWGLSPLPDRALGPYGKPFFPDCPEYQFNLSHSGDLLVCALDRAPVGVDVQLVRPCSARLLNRVCSEEERRWLRRRGDDCAAFALLWTMKESRCKQSGRGLTMPISDISVPLPQGEETVLEWDGLFFSLASGPGWQLSLCGHGPWDRRLLWLPSLSVPVMEA